MSKLITITDQIWLQEIDPDKQYIIMVSKPNVILKWDNIPSNVNPNFFPAGEVELQETPTNNHNIHIDYYKLYNDLMPKPHEHSTDDELEQLIKKFDMNEFGNVYENGHYLIKEVKALLAAREAEAYKKGQIAALEEIAKSGEAEIRIPGNPSFTALSLKVVDDELARLKGSGVINGQ